MPNTSTREAVGRRGRVVHVKVIALLLVTIVSPVVGQQTRYELGLRVKRFERLFEDRTQDEDVRKRVLPFLESAVQDFFTLRHQRASGKLDQASRELLPADQKERGDLALSYAPATRLIDGSVRTLKVTLRPFYGELADLDFEVTVGLHSTTNCVAKATVAVSEGAAVLTFDELAEGDYQLRCGADDFAGTAVSQVISVVNRVDERLVALKAGVEKVDPAGTSPLARSVQYQTSAIRALVKNQVPETDLPVHEVITEFERWVAAGKPQLTAASSRILLTAGKRSLPCRISVPAKALTGTSRPLVIALHGAGGSENMFYEAYGAGKVVTLCRERDWVLVCPKISVFGFGLTTAQILESLGELGVAVDKANVFVVGHSMGAGTTMQLAGQPTALRGIAPLAGGGSGKLSDVNRNAHYFVAAGDRDFGLRPSRALAKSLKTSAADVDFRVYKNTEHLGIVQVAFDDVFEFFDSVLQKKN